MEALLQDIRYAVRQLAKRPAFTAAAALTLALGIGTSTAIFSVANGVLLRPLPYADPDRLVMLWETTPQLSVMMVAYPDFLDWRSRSRTFDEVAVYNRYHSMNLTGAAEPERLAAAMASANLFRTLGVRPALGRAFQDEEDQPGAARVAIISAGLWQRRFGGAADVVGRTITLDGDPYTIVGVTARTFQLAGAIDVWVPVGPFITPDLMNRNNHPGLVAIARLRPGTNLQGSREDMARVAGQLAADYPASNQGVGVTITPLGDIVVGGARPTIEALLVAVGLVLLIACVNVANLLLALGTSRVREIGVRFALGASRARVVRGLLTESIVLALVGGAAGVGFALWGVAVLRAHAIGIVPRVSTIAVDWWVLAFSAGISVAAGLGFGVVPALRAARTGLTDSLREGGWRATTGRASLHARRGLVGAEVGLSLVLLIAAGLMIRSFMELDRVAPGIDPHGVLTMQIALPSAKYPSDESGRVFFRTLLERLSSLPDVRAAGIGDPLPFGQGGWQAGVTLEGVPEAVPGQNPLVDAAVVNGDYFQALRIPLLRGRRFTEADNAQAPRVVLVSAALVQRFWPGQDAVGKRIHFGGAADTGERWMSVIGVVGDVRRDLEAAPRPEFYLPYSQAQVGSLSVVLRTEGDPSLLAPAARRAILAIDPDQPVFDMQTMTDRLGTVLATRRFRMLLFGVFAAVALGLALLGIYSVMSQLVAQRTHEIGVRLALGAQPGAVRRLVLRQAMQPVLAGLGAGLLAALATSRLLVGLLFGVRPADPLTFGAVTLLVVAAALTASYLPARRAAGVDPVVALRTE
jgi:putative ABC transport system permease protein